MKKLLLKYLPIPVAIILAVSCFFTISYYDENMTEYATLSYVSNYISVDMTVSQTGKITAITAADIDSNEKLSEFNSKGRNASDLIFDFSKHADEGETVFVGVYVLDEEYAEPDYETLRAILETACSKLEISCLASYGTYDSYDVMRSLSYKKSLGKIAFCSLYSDMFSEKFREYVDAYLIYDSDPYELEFYLEFICEKFGLENYEEVFNLYLSRFERENNHIGKENAEIIARQYLDDNIDGLWDSFGYSGYKFDYGTLGYSFDFRYNGENKILFVNVNDGSVQEYFLDDY